MNPFILRESIASVAMSHAENHDCDICRAARGDENALVRVISGVVDAEVAEQQREFNRTADKWTSPAGVIWNIHNGEACKGHSCAFHNPSDHRMKDWPLDMNEDKGLLVERICEHDIRHPDPDSVNYLGRGEEEAIAELQTHDCDGCCK